MDKEISFEIKNHKKLNRKIIFITYIKEVLSTDEKILDSVLEKYTSTISENKGCIVIVDTRQLKKVSLEYVWSKLHKVRNIDQCIKQNVFYVFYLINSKFIKVAINSMLSVYKPVTKTKLLNSVEETMKFLNQNISTLQKE